MPNSHMVSSVGPASARASAMAADVVGCIGSENFPAAALERIHRLLPLGAWTVYQLNTGAPPEFSMGATRGKDDITSSCWNQYRAGLYTSDHSFDDVAPDAPGEVALARLDPVRLAPAHRAAIYEKHAIQERISVVAFETATSLLALNFYRFYGQQWFDAEDEIDLQSSASVLLAAVKKHLELRPLEPTTRQMESTQEMEILVLRAKCPRLTERELEVCAGLVQGWSFDGIAVRLNVSAATVKTYRDRAFRRLNINHRNQLYGMCVQGVVQQSSGARSTNA